MRSWGALLWAPGALGPTLLGWAAILVYMLTSGKLIFSGVTWMIALGTALAAAPIIVFAISGRRWSERVIKAADEDSGRDR